MSHQPQSPDHNTAWPRLSSCLTSWGPSWPTLMLSDANSAICLRNDIFKCGRYVPPKIAGTPGKHSRSLCRPLKVRGRMGGPHSPALSPPSKHPLAAEAGEWWGAEGLPQPLLKGHIPSSPRKCHEWPPQAPVVDKGPSKFSSGLYPRHEGVPRF